MFLLTGCTAPYIHDEGFIFGTTYHICYQSDQDFRDSIQGVFSRVDQSLSLYNSESLLSRINQNESDSINAMLYDVLQCAEDISKKTNGAFDITIAPLTELWGFGKDGKFHHDKIDEKKVNEVKTYVGYRLLSFNRRKIHKRDPRMSLDCGAVAKGYAVDCIAAFFLRHGVRNFLIEIGGEIIASGKNGNAHPWTIGIASPIDDSTQMENKSQQVFTSSKAAIATSGNYRRFYYSNGKKVAHTLNPVTGYPVIHNMLSATVIAPTCAQADALATAFMVMGLHKSQAFLSKNPNIAAYFILSAPSGFGTWHTKNFPSE